MKANIQHFGYDFPPVSIISILESYNPNPNYKFYILDPFNGVELPYDELKISPADTFVIVSTHEPAAHFWFDRLLNKLLNECKIPANNILLRTACLRDVDSPVPRVNTIADELSTFVNKNPSMVSLEPTHHFLCLNKMHRWQRFQLVVELLERGLDQFGKISYIDTTEIPKSKFNDRFPMVIDCPTVDWHTQFKYTDQAMTGALFNIITESSYEPKPGTVQIDHHCFPALTEKTYKCFGMAQIPIWLAPYQAVKCYRDLGFDVFDDVVSHEYDNIEDPQLRVTAVCNQIEKICSMSIEQLKTLKQELAPRFVKNFELLKFYSGNYQAELPQWHAWLSLANS